LTADRAAAGAQTPALSKRMVDLARYAAGSGADGILFTCSAFGEGIELAAQQLSIPVLKPNEAMFDAALAIGGRIGMLATFEPAVASMEEEFRTMAQAAGSEATLETVIVPGGRAALMANDLATHDQLIARATAGLDHCDAILLAHFSMATAESAAQSHTRRPVLSAPASAVVKLKAMIGER
ncbi:MAG TPA: aspartate/glutamate racemase family protein, partial [Acidisoma sp.]|uniref:aspartate/glutamate racemase family protein n=1 Tax=Acidisoma sp. TaxID=1872115 RepID=UPI002CC858C1